MEQIKLAVWLEKQGIKFTASANGGKRHIYEAINLKRMGVSPGFPDIEIPLPKHPYHGLYIEMKSEKGRLSREQTGWLNYLNSVGYLAKTAFSFDEAKKIVIDYLAKNEIDSIQELAV